MEMVDDTEIRFNALNDFSIHSGANHRQQKLGSMIENSLLLYFNSKNGKIKIKPQTVIKAHENVYLDSSSRNYVPDTEECSLFNYLDALSTLVTQDSKDIINRFEKCALCVQILNSEL
jgi:preprotein translocase subunit Sec61beta